MHVMLRVENLTASIAFYTEFFGLKVLRQTDYPAGGFTLAFLGAQSESVATAIELTHNWEPRKYEKGDAFGHLAFAVGDIYAFCRRLKSAKVTITREPAPMQFDQAETIAFVEDPDGYCIELIQV